MAKAKKLPSGNYRVLLYEGMKDGKRQYASFTAETADEAEYQALEYKLGKKRKETKSALTLENAMTFYIDSNREMLSITTIAGYDKIKKLYFDTIKKKPLHKITQDDIQAEINLQSKTLSPKTVKNNHGFLSAVFKAYRKDFSLETRLPKNKKFVPNIPDTKAIEQILKGIKDTDIEIPVLLAIWLGMRMSEIRGLKWDCIKGNKITIKQAMVDAYNSKHIKTTKTMSSTRVLYMPDYLKQLIAKQPKTSEYLVTLKRFTITGRFDRMLKQTGLPHYRFHDLRHANASIMLMLGVPDKYAMDRLGHSTNNTLKNIYQHTLDSKKEEVNASVNNYFEKLMQHEMQHEERKV